MTTYFKPLLASLALLIACTPPSDNVGEVPSTTEDGNTDTGPSAESEGTETETSVGAETTAATEVTGNTEDTAGTEDTSVAGGCLDVDYECFGGEHQPLECGGSPICDTLEVNDPSLNEFDEDPFGFVNPEAATCILEGLAAGTVGTYEIEVEPGQQYSISHRLEVLGDGSVVIRTHSQEDKSCDGHEDRSERQPASYFEACETEADEALILQCVLGAGNLEACVDQGDECPA